MFSTLFQDGTNYTSHETFADLSQYLFEQGTQSALYLSVQTQERNACFCTLQNTMFSHTFHIWRNDNFVAQIRTSIGLHNFTEFSLKIPVNHMHIYNFGNPVLNYVNIHFAQDVVYPFSLDIYNRENLKKKESVLLTNWQQEGF